MLTVVRPPPEGQGTDPPGKRTKRPHAGTPLTDTEQARLRAALRNLRALHGGTWDSLAAVLGVRPGTLAKVASGADAGTANMALRAARAAGAALERVIGAPVSADRCPHCGSKRGSP